MPYTDSMVTQAEWIVQLLEDNKAELLISDVFYGDQQKIPRTPAVCVEPAVKRREISGAPRQTTVTIQTVLLIYLMRVDSIQETRRDADAVAEAVEAKLHEDPQMGELVIHSLVVTMESGYAYRGNSLFRTARLTFEATSKVGLPLSGGA